MSPLKSELQREQAKATVVRLTGAMPDSRLHIVRACIYKVSFYTYKFSGYSGGISA